MPVCMCVRVFLHAAMVWAGLQLIRGTERHFQTATSVEENVTKEPLHPSLVAQVFCGPLSLPLLLSRIPHALLMRCPPSPSGSVSASLCVMTAFFFLHECSGCVRAHLYIYVPRAQEFLSPSLTNSVSLCLSVCVH